MSRRAAIGLALVALLGATQPFRASARRNRRPCVPATDAEETARHVDATMKRCILALYRSAVHVGRE